MHQSIKFSNRIRYDLPVKPVARPQRVPRRPKPTRKPERLFWIVQIAIMAACLIGTDVLMKSITMLDYANAVMLANVVAGR